MIVRLTQYISAYRFSDCPNLTVYVTKLLTLYWQGHILSGQGCFRVLLCCFSLRVRPVHVLQAPCRAPKRPLSDSLTSSRFDFGIFKEAEWGVLNVNPLNDDAEIAEIRPLRHVSPCQFRVWEAGLPLRVCLVHTLSANRGYILLLFIRFLLIVKYIL